MARCIEDDAMKVAFAMSNLAGRAKTWAFGRRLADATAFSSYRELTKELKATFEPPKSEFRARTEFLAIKQGKRDIQAYCQYARYLVSCIVEDPIDETTQVVTFMTGLTDGPVKTYLFREYPVTLEDAISIALQEEFSLQQAYVHSSTYRPPRSKQMNEYGDGPEPMDLSEAELRAASFDGACHRCQKQGHHAYECMAPAPVPRASGQYDQRGNRNHSGGRGQNGRGRANRQGSNRGGRGQSGNRSGQGGRPKNANSQ